LRDFGFFGTRDELAAFDEFRQRGVQFAQVVARAKRSPTLIDRVAE
jgi:hypothetical protein